MMHYILCFWALIPQHLGSSGNMTIVGNSDRKLFLATKFILGVGLMKGVHNELV